MKIKITRRRIIFLVLLILSILLIATIFPNIPWPVYSVNYYGATMGFRANLRDAKNVPVYPNEEIVYREIMNPLVENITIAFKPGTEQENAYDAVETFEIVNKLAIAFSKTLGYIPSFNVINVTSYDGLQGKIRNPIITLVNPNYSNETSVRLDDHVIFITGKNSTDSKEQLKNFDLAVIKFLMVALEIRINH